MQKPDTVIDGRVNLYLGECTQVMHGFEDDCIDLVVTSPPYDDILQYNGYTFDYRQTIKQLYRITKPGGVVVWVVADQTKNGTESGTSFRQALYAMDCGFNLHDTMIWCKEGGGGSAETPGTCRTPSTCSYSARASRRPSI